MAKKSELSVPQRLEIVMMILRKEEPISVLSRRFKVSENTLHRWREDFLEGGKSALSYGRGKGKADPRTTRIQELEQELNKRDQVSEILMSPWPMREENKLREADDPRGARGPDPG